MIEISIKLNKIFIINKAIINSKIIKAITVSKYQKMKNIVIIKKVKY